MFIIYCTQILNVFNDSKALGRLEISHFYVFGKIQVLFRLQNDSKVQALIQAAPFLILGQIQLIF